VHCSLIIIIMYMMKIKGLKTKSQYMVEEFNYDKLSP
jgi:hypothetical protein